MPLPRTSAESASLAPYDLPLTFGDPLTWKSRVIHRPESGH
jgi:hypothetical protein